MMPSPTAALAVVLAASTARAEIELLGMDNSIRFGDAVLHATCRTSAAKVVDVNFSAVCADTPCTAPSLGGVARATLHGVPETCLGALPSVPCASSHDPVGRAFFYCEWAGPHGVALAADAPVLAASAPVYTAEARLVGTHEYVDCALPPAAELWRVLGYEAGLATQGSLRLALIHYYAARADSAIGSDGTRLGYVGVHDADALMDVTSTIST